MSRVSDTVIGREEAVGDLGERFAKYVVASSGKVWEDLSEGLRERLVKAGCEEVDKIYPR